MPTNKAACPVCNEKIRTDNLPRHVANHTDLVSTVMSEKNRRLCCEKGIPLFYDLIGKSEYKFCVCLVCKKGKTLHNNGDIDVFADSHKHSKECVAKFETVRAHYGFEEGAVAPVVPISVEFMTRPSLAAMEKVHKVFSFDEKERHLPIDQQLEIMCSRLRATELARDKNRETPEAKAKREAREKEALRTEQEIAEATRLALIAERCGGVIPEQTAPAVVVEVQAAPIVVVEEPVKTAPILVVEEPVKVAPIRKAKAVTTPPPPPTPPTSSDSDSDDSSSCVRELFESLASRINIIYEDDLTPDEARQAYGEDQIEIDKYIQETRVPDEGVRSLDYIYSEWLLQKCTTEEMRYAANRIPWSK